MSQKILVIDDDIDLVEVLRIVLEKEGYAVLDAQDGERGIKMVREHKPDLIILDVMMSTEDEGFDVATRLDADPQLKQIPVIMLTAVGQMTGYKYDKDKDNVPVEEYIEKPIMPNALLKVIRRYI